MDYSYETLKRRLEVIDELRRQLADEEVYVLGLLHKVCPHKNLIRLEVNPVLVEMGLDDGRPCYKCDDCLTYFDKDGNPVD